jgi:hypothetical protein
VVELLLIRRTLDFSSLSTWPDTTPRSVHFAAHKSPRKLEYIRICGHRSPNFPPSKARRDPSAREDEILALYRSKIRKGIANGG